MARISSRGARVPGVAIMSAAVDLLAGVVAVLDDGLVEVGFVDGDRSEQDRRNVDLAIVDPVRRVHRLLAGQLDRSVDRSESERLDLLVDRHRLRASDNAL